MQKSSDNKRRFLMMSASVASVSVAVILVIIKFYAYYKTDAISILAGLVDSLLDVAVSVINFFAIRYALHPADADHRFGHGKAEAIAGLFQAILISSSVFLILVESVVRLFDPHPLQDTNIGLIVSGISLTLTAILVLFQEYVIRRTNSLAVKSDMLHYQTDFVLNASIFVSLFLTQLSGYAQIDSLLAIAISAYITYGVKKILLQSFDQILDKELSDEERRKIYYLATSHPEVHSIHDLRTRSSGGIVFIQFHMELPPEKLLLDVHKISEEVEDYIQKNYPQKTEIFIHVDPLGYPRENHEVFH